MNDIDPPAKSPAEQNPSPHSPGPSGPTGGSYKKGDLIGQRYAVYGVLGRGGFGIVYLVRKTDTKAIYALKTFRDDQMSDPEIRDRFRREAQVWVDLGRHPYLVRAYFVDEIDFRLFLAMEFIAPGEDRLNSLDRYLRHQPPDLVQSLRWSVQICRGMEYAYSRGVRSHRDIKPANILIDRQLNVKISDFGLANLANQTRVMGEGGMGTPAYMPPEQFVDANLCDERSDLYSFGVVLYQMAAGGRLPFLAPLPKTHSPQELAGFYREMFRLQAKIPPAKLDSPLDSIIRRTLEKRPDRRFPSFGELRADLEALLFQTTGERIEPPTAREMDASDWNNQGMSLDSLGLYAEAGPCFEQALELDPSSAVAWNNRANNLRQLGRFAEADACYDRALALDPSSAMAWNNKGGALLVAGREAESIVCFERALERKPSYAIAWHNKGFALNHLGRFAEAAGVFDRALELNPRSVFSWYQKGNALRCLGREAEAAACYAGAVELDPQFALSALRHFDHALELNPRNAAAWYDKAEAEERLLRKRAAADSYRHYLELSADPNAPQVDLARRRIVELAK